MPGPATFDPDHPTARDVYDRSQHGFEGPVKEIRGPQDRIRAGVVPYHKLFDSSDSDDDGLESKPGGGGRE